MKECIFHLPLTLNSGANAKPLVSECLGTVSRLFGGCTAYEAQGLWSHDGVTYDETVTRVVVAVSNHDDEQSLRGLAATYAARMDQLALYWRGADGVVEIIGLASIQREAA